MKYLKALTLTLLAGALSTSALHADAKFGGTVSYKLKNGALEVHADRITNQYRDASTGSLQMQVFATPSHYCGGEMPGSVLGTVALNPLYPGNQYQDVCQFTSYHAPQHSGCYYLTVALLEYRSCGYVVVDYVNMPGKVDLVGTCPTPVYTPRFEPVYTRPVYAPREVDCARPLPGYVNTRPARCETPVTVYRQPAPVCRESTPVYRSGGYGVPTYGSDRYANQYVPITRSYSRCVER